MAEAVRRASDDVDTRRSRHYSRRCPSLWNNRDSRESSRRRDGWPVSSLRELPPDTRCRRRRLLAPRTERQQRRPILALPSPAGGSRLATTVVVVSVAFVVVVVVVVLLALVLALVLVLVEVLLFLLLTRQ
jgi:Flp pilus assembly protein TadB